MNELNIFKTKLFIRYSHFYICASAYVHVPNYHEIFFDNTLSSHRQRRCIYHYMSIVLMSWFDWHIDSDQRQILINYLVIIDKMYYKV